jgi:hypothetical protein
MDTVKRLALAFAIFATPAAAADSTITGLPAGAALGGTEPIPMDQAAATKRTTPAAINTFTNTLPRTVVSATSGGIPCFTSTTAEASSGVLAASALVIGGGAGVCPSTTTTGTGVVTAAGLPVNTNGGLVTSSTASIAAGALLTGGGSATAISGITPGTGVATGLAAAINTNGGLLTGSTAAIAANAIVTGAGSGTALTGTTPGTNVLTALGVATEATGSFTRQNGAIVAGNCLKWSVTGIQDAGAACGAGGGGTPGGSVGQIQYNNTTFAGANLWQGSNLVEQRNGANAQAWRIYNGYTDASNGSWLEANWSGNTMFFRTQYNGTGAPTTGMNISASGGISLESGAFINIGFTGKTWQFDSNGAVQYASNLYFLSPGAGIFQHGNIDVDTNAGLVAQTLQAQSVLAGGTATQAGKDWSFIGSKSKGTATSGDIVMLTGAANAASTTVNNPVEVIRFKGSATTSAIPGRILAMGAIESGAGNRPTAAGAGGTCATGAIAGGANAGTVTLTGACAATNTVTLTFPTASATGWSCFASNRTVPATLLYETSTTTTTAVLTASGTTSGATDVLQYACTAY